MTDTIAEQLTPEQAKAVEDWKSSYRRRGLPITPHAISMIMQNVASGIFSPEGATDRALSPEERKRFAQGKGFVEYLPEELRQEPEKKMHRRVDMTQLENNIREINAQLQIKDYPKPEGEVVNMEHVNWAKYGWANTEKDHVREQLHHLFHFHEKEQADRAMEVLLIAGYTAEEVSNILNDPRVAELRNNVGGAGSAEVFKQLFPQMKYRSSLYAVFNEELRQDTRSQDFLGEPENMEQFAWQLSWSGTEGGTSGLWMHDKKYPLLEIRAEEKIVDGKKKLIGKYAVNETNFMMWFRKQLEVLYDIHGPNTPINVMHDIKLEKSPSMYNLGFREILEKQGVLFRSEDQNTQYLQTWLQLQWEMNSFQTLYDDDIIYRHTMYDEKVWLEKYKEMMIDNPLTKLGFRSNTIQQLLIGNTNYMEGREGGRYESDNKMGTAFLEMTLAYYNLGDFKELQRILGPNSSFFTRDGWMEAIKGVQGAVQKRPGGGFILNRETTEKFEKAFDKNGRVKDKQSFIEFINFFTTNLPSSHLELVVRQAVQNSVAERYDFLTKQYPNEKGKPKLGADEIGLSLTEAKAWFFNRLMGGGARNDIATSAKGPNPSVHDAMSRAANLNANRIKYAQGEGKPYGNLQTIGKHLAALVIPMLGITTEEEVPVLDDSGKPVKDSNGKQMYRKKSILKVFEELHTLRVNQQTRIKAMKRQYHQSTGEKRDAWTEAILHQEREDNKVYQRLVQEQATFTENAQREYITVHLEPGFKWMDRVMNGKGIDLNEFNNYDTFGGVHFNREKFIKTIQSDLIGTVRDMWKKYHWINFNEDVRAPFYNPVTGKQEFRNAKLGMTLFGYDVLNREEFWKTDSKGRPIKRYGIAEIDFNKVQKNKLQVMKQVFMTELAADLYNHQLMNSGDVRFKPHYYLNVIDSLKSISGKLLVDQLAKHGIKVTEDFLSKKDIEWLKARALNGNLLWWDAGSFGFHLKWWLTSLWDKKDKEGLGFGRMFSIIAKEAFAGGPTA